MHPRAVPTTAAALDRARELASERRWGDLSRLFDGLPAEGTGSAELDYLLADALRRVGRMEPAGTLALRAEGGASRAADRRLLLRVINLLGMLAFEWRGPEHAQPHFDRLLERATEWGDDEFVARASNNLGVLASVRGERELAMTFYQRAMAAYHRLGHTRGMAQTSYNLGISYRDLGFAAEAEQHYVASLRYAELSSSEDVVALAETERAHLRAKAGDGELAERLATRALERHIRMEDPGGSANARRVLAAAAEARGEMELALERIEAGIAITETHPDPLLRAELHRERGRLRCAVGDEVRGQGDLHSAATAFAELGAAIDASETWKLLERLAPAPPSSPPEAGGLSR